MSNTYFRSVINGFDVDDRKFGISSLSKGSRLILLALSFMVCDGYKDRLERASTINAAQAAKCDAENPFASITSFLWQPINSGKANTDQLQAKLYLLQAALQNGKHTLNLSASIVERRGQCRVFFEYPQLIAKMFQCNDIKKGELSGISATWRFQRGMAGEELLKVFNLQGLEKETTTSSNNVYYGSMGAIGMLDARFPLLIA